MATIEKTKAAAPAITRLKLLKPHTHARRDYPAGAELDMAALAITQEDAAWLIGVQTAINPDAPADTAPAAE